MDETNSQHTDKGTVGNDTNDLEAFALVLFHKVHRNLRSSQVEIVPLPHYYREPEPEPEPKPDTQADELIAPTVNYAPPLPAYKEKKNWWDIDKPVYAFNDTIIRSRIEKLMGSHIVQVMDRKYMVRLQERIREEHMESLKARIQQRETDEIEREKNLILDGKIPFEQAPKELKNHSVCRINQLVKKVVEERRMKAKLLDKTWGYRTTATRGKKAENLYDIEVEPEDEKVVSHVVCIVDDDISEDIAKGFMYTPGDYQKLKYEDPTVEYLREIEVVQDLYEIAEKTIGPLSVNLRRD